ncbi:MAG: hypothetical protein JWQ03_3092 [Variovorax sp.]|nr:hypothetical protein [Variovorax sp.]
MSREAELTASEQMRDRIADHLHASALSRGPNTGGGRVYRALLAIERRVRSLPGRLAQPAEDAAPQGIATAIPCIDDLVVALSTVPEGWWWSIGTCSVSNDASIGPDVAHCDRETLIRFDDGLHADLPHPSTIAEAVRDVVAQALSEQVRQAKARVQHDS